MSISPKKTKKTTVAARWDQRGFERMLEKFKPERRAEDEAYLKDVFNRMAQSPTAKSALDWALAHGVRFFVDHTVRGAGGYYTPGTGVVAVAAPYHKDPDRAVSILAHEIRHAWQDEQGLMAPPTGDFATYSIQNALIEADAYVYESLARTELNLSHKQEVYARAVARAFKGPQPAVMKTWYDNMKEHEAALADSSAYRMTAFYGWFNSNRAYAYGHALTQTYGYALGLVATRPYERAYEFSPAYTGHTPNIAGELGVPLGDGVDVTSFKNVLRLGRGFDGGESYLTGTTDENMLQTVLNPGLALTFYRAANDNARALNQKIQEETLKPAFLVKVRSGLGKG